MASRWVGGGVESGCAANRRDGGEHPTATLVLVTAATEGSTPPGPAWRSDGGQQRRVDPCGGEGVVEPVQLRQEGELRSEPTGCTAGAAEAERTEAQWREACGVVAGTRAGEKMLRRNDEICRATLLPWCGRRGNSREKTRDWLQIGGGPHNFQPQPMACGSSKWRLGAHEAARHKHAPRQNGGGRLGDG